MGRKQDKFDDISRLVYGPALTLAAPKTLQIKRVGAHAFRNASMRCMSALRRSDCYFGTRPATH